MFKLHADWKIIVKKAWSFKFGVLAGCFSGIEVLLPMFTESIPQKLFALLAFVAAFGGVISRVFAQRNL